MANKSLGGLKDIHFGDDDPSAVATAGEVGDLYIKTSAPTGIFIKTDDGLNTNWDAVGGGGGSILTFTSDAGAGGSNVAVLNVPGLLATDTVLGVSLLSAGLNNKPMTSWQDLGNDTITINFEVDPGANVIAYVSVLR